MITQFATPCWIVLREDPRDAEETHYSAEEVLEELARLREQDPSSTFSSRPLPGPCWVATCGLCGKPMDTDEFDAGHGEELADLVMAAASSGWLITEDLECYCRGCRAIIERPRLQVVPAC